MDHKTAKLWFEHGATLIFLNVPSGTEFGIDYMSWTVGPKFKGVKMIPPGVHLIYFSAANKDGQHSPRTAFFHIFKQHEILVKKWDAAKENISDDIISDEEVDRFTKIKKELDPHLGPYPHDKYKDWVSLSNHINEAVVKMLQPEHLLICSATPLENVGGLSTDRLPNMEPVAGSMIRFSEIPKKPYPEGATPSEISKHNMDKSYALATMFEKYYSSYNMNILGELQFAFVCFLIGQVYEAFETWKQLLNVLCSCEMALVTHPTLYENLVTVLHFQIHCIPSDFFVDIVSNDNFLVQTLRKFFSHLESSDADVLLKQKALRFREHLEKKFKWDFEGETEEDKPVLVEQN